jgi:hypothetical protein
MRAHAPSPGADEPATSWGNPVFLGDCLAEFVTATEGTGQHTFEPLLSIWL